MPVQRRRSSAEVSPNPMPWGPLALLLAVGLGFAGWHASTVERPAGPPARVAAERPAMSPARNAWRPFKAPPLVRFPAGDPRVWADRLLAASYERKPVPPRSRR